MQINLNYLFCKIKKYMEEGEENISLVELQNVLNFCREMGYINESAVGRIMEMVKE